MKTFLAAILLAIPLAVSAQTTQPNDLTLKQAKYLFDTVENNRNMSGLDYANVWYVFGLLDAAEVAASVEYGLGDDAEAVRQCFYQVYGKTRGQRLEKMYEDADVEIRNSGAQFVIPIITAGVMQGCAIGLGIRVKS